MAFIGILASVFVSIFILPALIKNSKKALLVLLLCILPFAGCANGIRYNVKGPPPIDNANTAVFFGAYKKNFNFRVISRTEPDGYRIVIMNDLGIKLQDMKIRKNEDTDVYFYVDSMPKEVIEDFSDFFKEYYFSQEKPNIKYESVAIYYYKNKEAVIWIKKI
jgi:hypothetical protein